MPGSPKLLALLAVLALLAAACDVDDPDEEPLVDDIPEAAPEEDPDALEPTLDGDETATVVELLAAHDSFTELVETIEDAGLEAELAADGPFTVFAPTDESFALVPDHEREQLVADPVLLEQRVLAHVFEGELTAEELVDGEKITMMDGTERAVLVTDEGERFVGSALVLDADAEAANGVVHAIDFVLPSNPGEDADAGDG